MQIDCTQTFTVFKIEIQVGFSLRGEVTSEAALIVWMYQLLLVKYPLPGQPITHTTPIPGCI